MTAYIRITRGEAMDAHGLRECCRRAGVTAGIDDALVEDLGERLSSDLFTHEGVIARGIDPQQGEAGRIEFEFPVEVVAGAKLADGRIDFHERNLLQSVRQGDELGRRIDPVEGTPGVFVDGLPIAVDAVEKVGFGKLGKGVRMVDDSIVEAVKDGMLIIVPHSLIDVVDSYEHRGDVDVASGDLHVCGSIEVMGDVAESYALAATKNVVVRGMVADASVEAGADITVQGGAMGKLAVLTAGHDLTCRHASRATLRAGGDVCLTDHGIDCHVFGHSVTVEQGRGVIVGSEVHARQSIHLIEAGNDVGALTILKVADTSRERRELLSLETEQRKQERRSQKRRGRAAGRGGKDNRARVGQSSQVRKARRELERVQAGLLETAEVTVRGAIHLGVRLCFGPHEREINAMERGIRYSFDIANGKIVEESYTP